MADNPQNNRRKAAQKFMHALDELEQVLHSEAMAEDRPDPQPAAPTRPSPSAGAHPRNSHRASFSQLMDEAVEDIEQFMSEPPADAEA